MLGGDCWYVNLPGEIGAMALHAFAGRMIRLRSAWGASGPRKGQKPTSSKFSFANLLSARRADNGRFIRKEVAMTTDLPESPRPLPDRPNLRHLKNQAKDLLKSGGAHSLTDAQFQIAPSLRFCQLAKTQSSCRIGGGYRAIEAGDRRQRFRQSEELDDAKPGTASRAVGLYQKWPAHLGGGYRDRARRTYLP